MKLQQILEEIYTEIQPYIDKGKVADYIPALARINAQKFGMSVYTVRGERASIGDAAEPFSIQSISKVFTLTMAMKIEHYLHSTINHVPLYSTRNDFLYKLSRVGNKLNTQKSIY
jgi:glutaminase